MPKPVFIAGGTGFVGSRIARALLDRGHQVMLLGRSGEHPLAGHSGVRMVTGNGLEPDSYADAMAECGAVINSVGIIREKKRKGITFENIHIKLNRRLLSTARQAGIRRYILISALGARPDGISRYQTTKFRAEQEVISSGVQWTIFHPSFVIGKGTGFIEQIAPIVKLPIVPVFGDGQYAFDPVDGRVLAAAVAESIERDAAIGVRYEVRGDRSWKYVDILEEIGSALGKKKVRKLHLPLWLAGSGIAATGWLPFAPITMDQFRMLVEGNTGTGRNAVQEFNLDWIPFPIAVRNALGE